MNIKSQVDYLSALARLTGKAIVAKPGIALTSATMMFVNNFILVMVWVIYFGKFSTIRGWGLADMSMLLGIAAWGMGLSMVVCGGVRDLARTIIDGGLDVHLGRPRHPLPTLLTSRTIPSGLGDMASAFIFWLWIGGRSVSELPLLLLVSTAAGVVFTATLVVTQCLVFWFPRAQSFCEDLFNMVLMVAFYPQHTYGIFVRAILFTVFPTAFMSFVPAAAVRSGSPWLALAMVAAAAAYSALAVAVFNRGLKLYSSGNRILEQR